jgi:hypothetical protein
MEHEIIVVRAIFLGDFLPAKLLGDSYGRSFVMMRAISNAPFDGFSEDCELPGRAWSEARFVALIRVKDIDNDHFQALDRFFRRASRHAEIRVKIGRNEFSVGWAHHNRQRTLENKRLWSERFDRNREGLASAELFELFFECVHIFFELFDSTIGRSSG